MLGLGPRTQGVLARYRLAGDAGPTATVLLIHYPSAAAAESGVQRFAAEHVEGKPGELIRKEKGWVGAKQRGRLVYCVLDATTSEEASQLLESIEKHREDQ